MSDEPIDFSPIDPSRDPHRWDALVARTTQRAIAARGATSVAGELARVWRPVTTVAAIVAAVALVWAGLGPSSANPVGLSADSVSEWANTGQIPHTVDVVALAGEAP